MPSVTKFTHSTITAVIGNGMPKIRAISIVKTSPPLVASKYTTILRILASTVRPERTALTIVWKLLLVSTISLASLAASVPDPIASPASASTSAGMSFTPSPVIAVISCPLTALSRAYLCLGSTRPNTLIFSSDSHILLGSLLSSIELSDISELALAMPT